MGYCWPCMSLGGGAYFAASAHICIGLFMTGYLAYFYLRSLALGLGEDGSLFVIFFIYALSFLLLGAFIFSGVEKKSTRIVKTGGFIFGVLHGLIFLRVIYVLLSKVIVTLANDGYANNYAQFGAGDTFGILFFTFLFFSSVIYLAILAMFVKNLQLEEESRGGNIYANMQQNNGDGNPLYPYNPVLCQP